MFLAPVASNWPNLDSTLVFMFQASVGETMGIGANIMNARTIVDTLSMLAPKNYGKLKVRHDKMQRGGVFGRIWFLETKLQCLIFWEAGFSRVRVWCLSVWTRPSGVFHPLSSCGCHPLTDGRLAGQFPRVLATEGWDIRRRRMVLSISIPQSVCTFKWKCLAGESLQIRLCATSCVWISFLSGGRF